MENRKIILKILENNRVKPSDTDIGHEGDHLTTDILIENRNFEDFLVHLVFKNCEESYITNPLKLENNYFIFSVPNGILKQGKILCQLVLSKEDEENNKEIKVKEYPIFSFYCGDSVTSDQIIENKYVGLLEDNLIRFNEDMKQIELLNKNYQDLLKEHEVFRKTIDTVKQEHNNFVTKKEIEEVKTNIVTLQKQDIEIEENISNNQKMNITHLEELDTKVENLENFDKNVLDENKLSKILKIKILRMTLREYKELEKKDKNTLYIITDTDDSYLGNNLYNFMDYNSLNNTLVYDKTIINKYVGDFNTKETKIVNGKQKVQIIPNQDFLDIITNYKILFNEYNYADKKGYCPDNFILKLNQNILINDNNQNNVNFKEEYQKLIIELTHNLKIEYLNSKEAAKLYLIEGYYLDFTNSDIKILNNTTYHVEFSVNEEKVLPLDKKFLSEDVLTIDNYKDIHVKDFPGRKTAEGGEIFNSVTNTASARYSTALGYQTKALGQYSEAKGYITEASGESSVAEGAITKAIGKNSHSSGLYTIAKGENQLVTGRYNVPNENYAFIIGNGENDGRRNNSMTVDWDGNTYTDGIFSQKGEPIQDKDLTTKKYVDNALKNKANISDIPKNISELNNDSGFTKNYSNLDNRPSINGVILEDNKTSADLKIGGGEVWEDIPINIPNIENGVLQANMGVIDLDDKVFKKPYKKIMLQMLANGTAQENSAICQVCLNEEYEQRGATVDGIGNHFAFNGVTYSGVPTFVTITIDCSSGITECHYFRNEDAPDSFYNPVFNDGIRIGIAPYNEIHRIVLDGFGTGDVLATSTITLRGVAV